ncbi:flagellar hook capping FlgD N-terminal domain-containing protein [Chryseomicrobium palamuruense]|uniref:Flagellar hook capping FlgD N-terminal domain-containing protein n=1 Tax=Chryseomicrobium palamuruense TaxID=682973 RepID=A0ABV8UXF7_9BACL
MEITSTTSAATQSATVNKKEEASRGLGQDAFMKILIAQLRNQNPLEPMKDADFIAQMAQFTSLEQLTSLNKTMTSYTERMNGKSMADYAEMIGKQISWKVPDTDTTESGIIQSIIQEEGKYFAQLQNSDQRIALDTVYLLESAPATETNQ